ncbi:MAG: hypothetical protein PWR01_2764 [Clostridiales bacterium]|jgi:two-component system alkaline phosphatase synthesis response regulator PhoP|nr:hypothetical protein [Clostridiales bacterium]MDN5281691.1 hypothetical protein [Candidatus Ozemobacter sp.]
MTEILIVEDETVIRELLSDNLEFEGFSTYQAADLAMADQLLSEISPSLILLDLNLPDGNGADRLKTWRSNGLQTPVIICTVRDREIDIIKALDAGADDYVTKPFRIRELIARIKAVIRRSEHKPGGDKLQIGQIAVNFSARTVASPDSQISLTATEWQILEYLAENRNQVLSRDQIIERIWGINDLEDSRAVDVHIGRLRKKIEADNRPSTLLTVRGFGYTLKL